MVILGLGSNLGDRLARLRQALHQLKQLPKLTVQQVSPVYISAALMPQNAPADWDRPYLNAALRCETTLTPHELLHHVKTIEKKLGRTPDKDWGPRIIDIDILAWDDWACYDERLHVPHEHLHERPFALWPLSDVAPHWIYPAPGPWQGKTAIEMAAQWGPRESRQAPLHIRAIPQRIDMPQLVGILNVAPGSFSDGGQFSAPDKALQHLKHLKQQGAEIIDLGAEATGPRAQAISAEEEWQLLAPILAMALAGRETGDLPIKISIDTRHPLTAASALAAGADWINDVSGLDHPAMREVVAASSCDIVFMHHLGVPVRPETLPLHENSVERVYEWAEKKLILLEQHAIARERLVFDPGIGYGKTAEQSLELIRSMPLFKSLGVRLLVGHSRKSFINQFTTLAPNQRDLETVTLSLYLAKQSVDYLRVHEVALHTRSFKVAASVF